MNITFTIPDNQASRITSAIKDLFPIPQIPVDPLDPTKGTKPQYTDGEWVKLKIIEWVKRQVDRSERVIAQKQITIASTDNIIS